MAMQDAVPWLIVGAILVLFPAGLVVMWTLVSVLLATVSGWRGLAARYPAAPLRRGTALAGGYANAVGGVAYRRVLTFEETDDALLVRVLRIFPFHPDLAIPWSALRAVPSRDFFAGSFEVAGGGRLN